MSDTGGVCNSSAARSVTPLYNGAVEHVCTDITLRGPKGTVTLRRALVDTGASLTTVSPDIARRLGLQPYDTVSVTIAGGLEREAEVAGARATIDGRSAPVQVVILPGQERPLIGVETLEMLGLRVNPSERPPTLEPTRDFIIGLF